MTDLQAKQSSSEQLNNMKGSDESVNQLRPASISHRPSQSQPKRSRDAGQPRVREIFYIHIESQSF